MGVAVAGGTRLTNRSTFSIGHTAFTASPLMPMAWLLTSRESCALPDVGVLTCWSTRTETSCPDAPPAVGDSSVKTAAPALVSAYRLTGSGSAKQETCDVMVTRYCVVLLGPAEPALTSRSLVGAGGTGVAVGKVIALQGT